jgi:subtilisin family serine protease
MKTNKRNATSGARRYAIIAISLLSTLTLYAHVERSYSTKLKGKAVAKIEQSQQSPDTNIQVFVRVADNADLQAIANDYGVKWNVETGSWHTALVPFSEIEALSNAPGIIEIDAGMDVRQMCDEMRQLTGVETLYNGIDLPTTYRGKGIIIGIIDSGFDFTHPNFKDADGNCRISTVWDQNSYTTTASDYGYGAIYDTPEAIAAIKHDNSGDTHGTHVLGIATGGTASQYRGVAPEAEIAIVSTNKSEQGIVDGLDYLIKYAEAEGKPLSVNISFGTVLGYKDGSSTLSTMIDNMLQAHPQCLLAIAAGNEGNRAANIWSSTPTSTILQMPSYGRDNIFFEGTSGNSYTLTIKLVDGSTTIFQRSFSTDTPESVSISDLGEGSASDALLAVSVTNETDKAPSIYANILYTQQGNEQFEINVETNGKNAPYALFADYGQFISGNKTGYSDGDTSMSIAATATGQMPIAVAAYTSRNTYTNLAGNTSTSGETLGSRYTRSGQGPTFDMRTKPEISAPGAAIISSFNSYAASYSVTESDKVYKYTGDSRSYTWGVASGTSMATPVVTGALALLQEVNPSITIEQARTLLTENATHDSFTGTAYSSYGYGYGKLDILSSIKAALESNSVTETAKSANSEDKPVYDMFGRKVAQSITDIKKLSPGIYISGGQKFIVR